MAGKSRSLNFILLVCALIGAALFYGCGGGGNSSDPIPVPIMQISGNIRSSGELANIAYEGNLLPDARAQFAAPGVTVHLESDVTRSTTTDSNGNYVLSGIPVGTHRVVARIRTLSGKTYKIISGPITVSERVAEVVAPQLELRQATVALSGILRKADGSAFPFARMTLWGEPFTTDVNGLFSTPPMPEGTVENIIIANSGFQQVKINSSFVENAPFIEQVVVSSAATNRAPTATLTATKYSVDRLYEVNLTGVALDPDNNIATYTWSANSGYFTSNVASDTQRMWVAPNADTIATLTFTAVDTGGLRGSASIQVKVGRGMVVPNNTPVISNITVSPTDLSGNRNYTLSATATDADGDTLAYSWNASASNGNIGRLTSLNSSSIAWVTPDVTATTSVTITLTVNDLKENGLKSRSQVFTVSPTRINQAPTNLAIDIVDLNNVATTTFYAYRDYILKGSATDPEGETITWQWSVNKGTVYTPTATSTRWLTPSTPQTAEITLTVTDIKGASSSFKRTVNILDSGLQRPDVSIVASPSGRIIKVAQNISFEGLATTSAGADITSDRFTWSETDGVISPVTINTGSKTISRSYAKPATYTIILEALDYVGVPGTYEYSFRVNATPTSSISQPANNASYDQYAAVTFTANASDTEDGVITSNSQFIWTFPAPTGVRTGRTFSLTDLATGTHNISLSVADALGDFSATSTVRITINENRPPVATITAPANNSTVLINTPLTFTATASDPEDTTIPAGNYFWTFPDPINATTGTSITVSNLLVSTQTIKLQVMDSRGRYSATRTVDVYVNRPPVISMISIDSIANASGAAVLLGSPARFGVSVDDEEGSLNQIAWYSGATLLGLGQYIEVSTLTAGLHPIEVRATDRRGAITASQTGVFINERPVMTIVNPATTVSVGLSQPILFEGSGTDTVGTVGLGSYRWYDYSYKLGATNTFNAGLGNNRFTFDGYTKATEFGTHTITLEGADQYNALGFAYREIFVNSKPTVAMTSPASGTRIDTGNDTIFTAMVYEDDSEDSLTVRWYADTYPSTVLKTEVATSSATGKAFSYNTAALASGPHTIFCEVTDMYGLQAVASTGVLINRLPYAQSGKIQISTTQYATAPSDIPVFISANPSMSISFSVDDFDYELNGTVNAYKPENIKWESDRGLFGPDSKGSTISQSFPIGYNEVTARIYDTFYPQFEHQASTSYKIAFYVWQSKDLLVDAGAVDIHGNGDTLFISSNQGPAIREFKYTGGAEPNPYILEDTDRLRDLNATATLNTVYSSSYSQDSKVVVLGSDGSDILYKFEDITSPVSHTFAGLAGARSLACNTQYATIAYFTRGTELVPFNPSTWQVDGTAVSAVDGVNFGTLGRVRYSYITTDYTSRVFVADTNNNRVIRFMTDSLGEPRTVSASAPIDIAATRKRLLTLSNTADDKITLHAVDNASSSVMMSFGKTGTGVGQFNNPVSIYFYEKDLLVLELGNAGNKRLQLIRSGHDDWLK